MSCGLTLSLHLSTFLLNKYVLVTFFNQNEKMNSKKTVKLAPKKFFATLAISIAIILLISELLVNITTNKLSASFGNQMKDFDSSQPIVAQIAKQVTVRVLTELDSGSGVIIGRQGSTYTVLTCNHVIATSKRNKYSILTFEDTTYIANRKSINFGDADLAILQFQSQKNYRIASLGNSNILSPGNTVYASGFANYNFSNKDFLENTRDWGNKAYFFTKGEVSILLERFLKKGYRLGYTNQVELGMSGGPVLNQKGQVIGINGRLKYPFQGIDAYTFTDGSKPSTEMFKKMETLSWAIPIATYIQAVPDSIN